MKTRIGAKRIGYAAASLALLLVFAPAAATAAESRAVLTVSAIVAPTCHVALQAEAEGNARVRCSTGTAWSSVTASSRDAQPLDEAAAILGEPVRHADRIVFTAPVRPVQVASDEPGGDDDSGAPYLTITY